MNRVREFLRSLLPFSVRVELRRVRRLPMWVLERRNIARRRAAIDELDTFSHLLASHESPLERSPGAVSQTLQRGKERNVDIAARLLDSIVLDPCQVFSYHHIVGRPTRLRGFSPGLELHAGHPSRGVGGGCCMISNMLYLLALRGGMKIVERHRHALDLFPDHDRTIPFGCGATVYYNFADLRFENPLPIPVLIRMRIEDRRLIGELWTPSDPGWRAEIYEVDHRFHRNGDDCWRENRIRRRFLAADGTVILDQEVAHNRGRVMYDVEELCADRDEGAP